MRGLSLFLTVFYFFDQKKYTNSCDNLLQSSLSYFNLWGLKNCARRPTSRLLFMVRKLNIRNIFWSSTSSPGVNFLKLVLHYLSRHPTLWLFLLVKKLSARNIYWCSTWKSEPKVRVSDTKVGLKSELTKVQIFDMLEFQLSGSQHLLF